MLGGEVFLDIEGGAATCAGGGDGLTVTRVSDIAGSEYAFDAGGCSFPVGDNIAVVIEF